MRGTRMASLLLIAASAAASGPSYTDPWSPDAEAAAEAAVARLGPHRALDLRPTVLTIIGVQQGVVAAVSEVRRAITALNAQENDLEIRVNLPPDVLFDFDKSDI